MYLNMHTNARTFFLGITCWGTGNWTMHAIFPTIMHKCPGWPLITQTCMNSSCRVRDFLCNLVGATPLAESQSTRQLKKPSTIKDTQTPGGTKGFILKPGAVSRYYLTSEYRSSYLRELRVMVSRNGFQHFNHPDLQLTRIRKDETDVRSFVELMENSWISPLSHDETELVNLSTGILAPPDVANDLLKAHKVGKEAYQLSEKIVWRKSNSRWNFTTRWRNRIWRPSSTSIKKQAGYKAKGNHIILKADRNLFGRMIIIAQSRALSIREVLVHPLGPIPWSLANGDGFLRKTNKAALARQLGKMCHQQISFQSLQLV